MTKTYEHITAVQSNLETEFHNQRFSIDGEKKVRLGGVITLSAG
jgi:hypothetical protein